MIGWRWSVRVPRMVFAIRGARRRWGVVSTLFAALSLSAAGGMRAAAEPVQLENEGVSRNDVIWTSPSRDENGSMPIGNGDLAANVWVETDGTLAFYLAKSDAWDDNARLLKLGKMLVRLEPDPLGPGVLFSQRLNLEEGAIEVSFGEGFERTTISIRVDAHRPVLIVEAQSAVPTTMRVTLDHWRTQPRAVKEVTWSDVYCVDWGKPPIVPTITRPDTFLPAIAVGESAELLWFHRNEFTPLPMTLWLQAIPSMLGAFDDPILHRAFGAVATGSGLEPMGDRGLRSRAPACEHRLEVWAATATDTEADQFVETLRGLARRGAGDDQQAAREAHRAWWRSFWNRSWIHVAENEHARPYGITTNTLPVSIGSDAEGGNRFKGLIERVIVVDRPLDIVEIRALQSAAPAEPDGALLVWNNGDPPSIAHHSALDAAGGLTIAAWIEPERQDPGGGRIVDKCPVGSSAGWTLDTYPSNSLRFIADDPAVTMDARLEPGRRVFVAAAQDPRNGQKRLFIDGEQVAESPASECGAQQLNRGYALQRYITACAGRGGAPIKFNGSLFTVPRAGHDDGDPDYRRWGPGFWFQNTRLIYWPLFASGDTEFTDAFFRLYRDALPLLQAAHRERYGDRLRPGSAAFHETIALWGLPDNSSFGWVRAGATPGEVTNPYIRHYRSGSIELLAMAIERDAFAPDPTFRAETLFPLADAILGFYASFYPRNDDGSIRFEPAASLETWHDATDPLPEIAGLHAVVPALIAIVEREATTPEHRARAAEWSALRAALPPIPFESSPEGTVIAPARRYDALANVENPPLYAIFPYRLFGVSRPQLDVARRTFAQRKNRANVGWCQDSIHAAYLGLADEAATMVVRRAASHDQRSRFPAFWGPNYDWVPDQDHGSNILTTVQSMLLQSDAATGQLLLLPAWPRGWDCDFRLHAPGATTLTGRVRNGRVETLVVDPPERVRDVVFANP